MTVLGTHSIATLVGSYSTLNSLDEILEAMDITIEVYGFTRVGGDIHFHLFEPYGLTAMALLAESHISIHTWPERGLAAIDFFTCGSCRFDIPPLMYFADILGCEVKNYQEFARQ
jgi:S-adenosylmethionine decarboxylase